VENNEGFTRKIEDVREADFRLANHRLQAASRMSQLRKSFSAASHFFNQLRTSDLSSFLHVAVFRAQFHAGFSSLLERTRMVAHRRSRFILISSQPVHVQHDPVGESRETVFTSRFVGTSCVKTLAVPVTNPSLNIDYRIVETR
jgi:hypothetical protein